MRLDYVEIEKQPLPLSGYRAVTGKKRVAIAYAPKEEEIKSMIQGLYKIELVKVAQVSTHDAKGRWWEGYRYLPRKEAASNTPA